MSRNAIYSDGRITVYHGIDHVLGEFYQLFDKEMEKETPEGEGLIVDWSQLFDFETNLTGMSNDNGILKILINYVEEFGEENNNFVPLN